MSFEEALRESEELLHDLAEIGCTNELQIKLNSMLSSVASCRGFFVSYLTGDSGLADEPPGYIVEYLKDSEHVPELLVKNLVMSTTMKITHERKGDSINAKGSERVARRTAQLIELVRTSLLRNKLAEMRSSIKTRAGVFADFLRRWDYDDEQLSAALAAIEHSCKQIAKC